MSDVLQTLAQLSPDELRNVQARVGFLLGADSPAALEPSDEDQVHEAIAVVLRKCGVLNTPPLGVIRRQRHYKQFVEGAGELLRFTEEQVRPGSRMERVKALRILVRMIANWLRDAGRPLSHMTISRSLKRVADISDQRFPGYVASGLMPVILRAPKVA
jgi:hypothetical protein